MSQKTERFCDTWTGRWSGWGLMLVFILAMAFANGQDMASLSWPGSAAALTCILAGGGLLRRGVKLPGLGWLGWLVIGIALYFGTRAIMSPVRALGEQDGIILVSGLMFWFGGMVAGNARRGEVKLLVVAALVVLANMLVFWYQRAVDVHVVPFRATGLEVEGYGFFGHYNYFGHCLGAIGVMALAFGITGGRSLRWGWLVVGGLALAGAVMSDSRGTLLAVAGGLGLLSVCWLVVQYRRRAKWFGASLVGVLLAGFLGAGGLYYAVHSLVESRGKSGVDVMTTFFNSGGRLEMTTMACELAAKAPLVGHGARSFTYESTPLRDKMLLDNTSTLNFVHNEFAQVWCDYGTTGLILMCAGLVAALIAGIVKLAGLPVEDEGKNAVEVGAKDSRDAALEGREVAARYAGRVTAGVAVLGFGIVHGFLDFAWHILPAFALCGLALGWICAPAHGKPGRAVGVVATRLSGVLVLAAGVGFGWLAWREMPVWFEETRAVEAENYAEARMKSRKVVEERALQLAAKHRQSAFEQSPTTERGILAGQSWLELAGKRMDDQEQVREFGRLAEAPLVVARELNPKDPYAALQLAASLDLQGKYDQAEPVYQALIAAIGTAGENAVPARLYYARHLFLVGNRLWYDNEPEAALSTFCKARQVFDEGEPHGSYWRYGFQRELVEAIDARIALLKGVLE